MAIQNSTAVSEASYVSFNQLADALALISSAMRVVESSDSDVFCLLDKAAAEIVAAQDYLEAVDPVVCPISEDIVTALNRIGRTH
ncbi:hypothetical protein [Dechloromonas sp. A34]|uniref:hypothetical protein n=1 Tax=Dechloromonas sp. A34 TaxID=447588 RepID=UPI0022495788|nr:hypothetical protein [Dechloromonas sp. A34]